jgi:Methionine synthase I, cobalamin-binding domain
MTGKTLSFDSLHINEEDVFRQMGYDAMSPPTIVAELTASMLNRLSGVASPRFGYVTAFATLGAGTLEVGDVTLHVGKTIAQQLRGAEAFAFFVATAGCEVEALQKQHFAEDDMLGSFIADAIGSVMAEHCADQMEHLLQVNIDKLGWHNTNRFSPGYCQWPVSDQSSLFSLLGDDTCGVNLNDQYVMSPLKSVSGVIGLGTEVRHFDYACALCKMPQCKLRKR